MPTKRYESSDEAYQALTDSELADDSRDLPVAKIKVKGVHTVKVGRLNSYDYFYKLIPFRQKLFDYYVNILQNEKMLKDPDLVMQKLKFVSEEIGKLGDAKTIQEKADKLMSLFGDANIREQFFRFLKAVGVVRFWVSWNRWQHKADPIHLPLIFAYLWGHNYDGLKKKLTGILLKIQKITADTSQQSPTGLINSGNWESYKIMLAEGGKRVDKLLQANSKN